LISYTVKRRAEIDLEGTWAYSAEHWGDDRADLYVSEIWRGIGFVAQDPRRGRSCDDIKTGYYRYSVSSHVLFYRITTTGTEIVRVLHQRMDFRRHL
jgi:toxin ParE1/3/4